MSRKTAFPVAALILGWLLVGAIPALAQQWAVHTFRFAYNCATLDAVGRDVVFVYGLESGARSAYVFRTTDGGETWDRFPWHTWGIYDLSAVDSNRVWAACADGRIYHSEDGGRTWSVQYDGIADSTAAEFDYIEMFDAENGVAAGDPFPGKSDPLPFLRTRDGGQTWTRVNDTSFVGADLNGLWAAVDFVDPLVGYYRESRTGVPLRNLHLHRTTDGGATWSPTPLRSDQFFLIRLYDENLGLAVWKENAPVYRTTDGGQTWASYPLNLGENWFNDLEFVPGDPSQVLAGVSHVLISSADTGRTWSRVLTLTPGEAIRDIDIVDSTLAWVATEGGILKLTRSSAGPTGALDAGRPPAPDRYALLSASPNPFSASTAIALVLHRSERVSLEVFDVLGRRVATLAQSRRLPPGRHAFLFDGADLPGGVYLIRLTTGAGSFVRRVVLLK